MTTYHLTAMYGSHGRMVKELDLQAASRADAVTAFVALLTATEKAGLEHVWVEVAG